MRPVRCRNFDDTSKSDNNNNTKTLQSLHPPTRLLHSLQHRHQHPHQKIREQQKKKNTKNGVVTVVVVVNDGNQFQTTRHWRKTTFEP